MLSHRTTQKFQWNVTSNS